MTAAARVAAPVGAQAPSPKADVMGATAHNGGCTFRIWAPFAAGIDLDMWPSAGPATSVAMAADTAAGYGAGCWSVFVPGVTAPTGYRFRVTYAPTGQAPVTFERVDPWGRAVMFPKWTASTQDDSDARSLLTSAAFAWGPAAALCDWHSTVIYQLHVGTFAQPSAGAADPIGDLIAQIPYLTSLGVNAVQFLPFTEFAGPLSLGYNAVLPFAIEHDYGDPADFKRLVKALHDAGLRVLVDVVYNHIDVDNGGPTLMYSLFQFDGWSTASNSCGVFFYGGDEMATPWSAPRPDYGRPQIQRYLQDNVTMWLSEYGVDGLRFDSTKCIRKRQGSCTTFCCGGDIGVERNFGWELMQNLNGAAHATSAGVLTIAEDLDNNAAITTPAS